MKKQEQIKKLVKEIYEIEEEINSVELKDIPYSIEEAVQGLYRRKDNLEKELSSLLTPTVDVGRVKEEFVNMGCKFNHLIHSVDNLAFWTNIFNFFLPYIQPQPQSNIEQALNKTVEAWNKDNPKKKALELIDILNGFEKDINEVFDEMLPALDLHDTNCPIHDENYPDECNCKMLELKHQVINVFRFTSRKFIEHK